MNSQNGMTGEQRIMEVTTSTNGEIYVVRIKGKLNTETYSEAEAQITQLIEQGAQKVLIELKELDYISSVGLRIFLKIAQQLKEKGGELRISSLSDMVYEIFDITGLYNILNVFKSETDALNNF